MRTATPQAVDPQRWPFHECVIPAREKVEQRRIRIVEWRRRVHAAPLWYRCSVDDLAAMQAVEAAVVIPMAQFEQPHQRKAAAVIRAALRSDALALLVHERIRAERTHGL